MARFLLKGTDVEPTDLLDATIAATTGFVVFDDFYAEVFPYVENENDSSVSLARTIPNDVNLRGVIEITTGWLEYPTVNSNMLDFTDGTTNINDVIKKNFLFIQNSSGFLFPDISNTNQNLEVSLISIDSETQIPFRRYNLQLKTRNLL